MNNKTSRRDFIKNLYYAIWGGLATNLVIESEVQAQNSKYKLHKWTGDDFKLGGHDLRDGLIPKFPKSADSFVDVVIIGGGLAGLATANYLQDRDFLLLEMYDHLGGHSRGSSFRGIDYTYGAAYYADDVGHLARLVEELKLKPAKLTENKDAWLWNDRFITEDRCPDHIFFKELSRIKNDVTKVSNLAGPRMLDAFKKTPELRSLDKVKMNSFLKGYDPKFVKLFDNFFKSSLCGSSSKISALSGLYLMEDLFNPTYILPGGNQAIANALIKKLSNDYPKSLKNNSIVWSVSMKENGASIFYSDSKKRPRRVDCKHVVIALPSMVAARILSNIDDSTKSLLSGFHYGSYLVANLLLNKRVFNQSYDNWFSPPYNFADISLADTPYLVKNSIIRNDASVLTLFQPYEAESTGRMLLLKGDRKEISTNLVEQVSKVIPEITNHLQEIVLSRWGHALAVPEPDFFKKIETLQSKQENNYSFAHSSSQGIPSAEAAVDAARRVVDNLNGKKLSSKPIYSIQMQ